MVVVIPTGAPNATEMQDLLQGVTAEFQGEVWVGILSATGLRDADKLAGKISIGRGKSDPYCTCKPRLAPAKAKASLETPCLKDTLEPEWMFKGQVPGIGKNGDALRFHVFDKDWCAKLNAVLQIPDIGHVQSQGFDISIGFPHPLVRLHLVVDRHQPQGRRGELGQSAPL